METDVSGLWIAFGLAAQLFFTARFLVQWIASERAGASVVPVAFWYLSLAGSGMLLAYAIRRRDPVFIVGQSAGFAIYLRNLHLIHAGSTRSPGAPREDARGGAAAAPLPD